VVLRKWLLIAPALGVLAAGALWIERGGELGTSQPSPPAESIVLVILDTVRADHMSACGYARPTTPFMQKLWSEAKFTTCQAYSPGSWTLPSHASFFTGLPVEQHGADTSSHGDASLPWTGSRFTPLSDRFATLAEKMRDQGYRTVLVSSNPVLNEASGLTRGFDHVKVAEQFGPMFGDVVVQEVRAQLDDVSPDEPLFLVVNISDAHPPWLPVPKELSWAPPRPVLSVALTDDSYWARYVRGDLAPAQLKAARAHYTDLYDFGIFRADLALSGVFRALHDHARLSNDYRVVVTSDHGDLLLEHGSYGHGGHAWEGAVRVPFLFLSDRPPPGKLREPFSATEAHRLLLGEAPLDGPVTSTSNWNNQLRKFFGDDYPQFQERTVALWKNEREKLLKRNDRIELYDIEADPNEDNPLPIGEEPLAQMLDAIAKQAAANDATAETSEELHEQLRALGYAE
jgi:arylsulfatase A-like enzyme